MSRHLQVGAEVERALAAGRPVVALETALVSHGLPPPLNLETAERMADAVRTAGAVPAAIGLLGGRAIVGLSRDDLRRLAGDGVAKASSHDLAPLLARGAAAGTTVAATVLLAARAGIRVLATGGIGGVHRGSDRGHDVSADLPAIARHPIAVVASGAKSILDLGRTLEALETLGVPVVGFGTDELPAFFARESGLALPHRVDSPGEAARLMRARWELDADGGILFAQPPPAATALAREEVEEMLAAALAGAAESGVRGPATTPYLLARLAEASGGRTHTANVDLLVANAALGARIAAAWAAA